MSTKKLSEGLSRGSIANLSTDIATNNVRSVDRFFIPRQKVVSFRPRWTGNCPLIFMPIGAKDSDGDFLPPVVSSEYGESAFTDFFLWMPVVNFVGSIKKVGFTLYDPIMAYNGEYDPDRNPYIAFRNTIISLVRQGKREAWKSFVFKSENNKEGPILPEPTVAYFFQGLVFQEGRGATVSSKGLPVGLRDEDEHLPVIIASKACGDAILQTIRGLYQPDDESDPIDIFQGNPAKYLVIANPEKHVPRMFKVGHDEAMTSTDVDEDDIFGQVVPTENDSDGEAFSTYQVYAEDRVNLMIANKRGKGFKDFALKPFPWGKIELTRKRVHARWRPLHELIRVTPHEEQVRMICEALADKPELVAAGFPEHSEFYNDDVARITRRRTSVRIPEHNLSDDLDIATSLLGDEVMTGENLKLEPDVDSSTADSILDLDW